MGYHNIALERATFVVLLTNSLMMHTAPLTVSVDYYFYDRHAHLPSVNNQESSP